MNIKNRNAQLPNPVRGVRSCLAGVWTIVWMVVFCGSVPVSCFGQDGSLLRGRDTRLTETAAMLAQRSNVSLPNTPAPVPNGQTLPLQPYDSLESDQRGVPLSDVSWTYIPPASSRVYQRNDIVTIRVDEVSRTQAEGIAQSRRNTLYDALLKDWIKLDGWRGVGPTAQADGDPRVQGTTNQLYRANASTETRESLTFNIAARIVDIRPSGDLVLEARKSIRINDNVWDTALSGVCRPNDIAADNVVLSRDLLDLQITKTDQGRLRDSYSRGWFSRWFDTFNPF